MNEDERIAFLRGRSNQDMALEELRSVWEKTDDAVQDFLFNWLATEDVESVRRRFTEFPDQAIRFFQQAAACGIREAVLLHASAGGDDDDNEINYRDGSG